MQGTIIFIFLVGLGTLVYGAASFCKFVGGLIRGRFGE